MLKYSSKNPFRVPDWKWQRVVGILDDQQPNATNARDTKEGKNWINRATRFKQRYDSCETDTDKYSVMESYPDLFWAYTIWLSNESIKWDIEAHILANCDNAYLSEYCSIEEDVAEAYNQLFFDVRSKLQNKGYILHTVFKESVHRGIRAREYDALWKLFGYFYGPYVLESLSSKTINPTWCGSPQAAGAAFEEDIAASLKISGAIAAKTYILNQDTQADVIGLYTKLLEIERSAEVGGAGESQLMQHIEAMFNTLPFSVGGRDPDNNHQKITSVINVENDSVELRFDEEMRVLEGEKIEDLKNFGNKDFEKLIESNTLENSEKKSRKK